MQTNPPYKTAATRHLRAEDVDTRDTSLIVIVIGHAGSERASVSDLLWVSGRTIVGNSPVTENLMNDGSCLI